MDSQYTIDIEYIDIPNELRKVDGGELEQWEKDELDKNMGVTLYNNEYLFNDEVYLNKSLDNCHQKDNDLKFLSLPWENGIILDAVDVRDNEKIIENMRNNITKVIPPISASKKSYVINNRILNGKCVIQTNKFKSVSKYKSNYFDFRRASDYVSKIMSQERTVKVIPKLKDINTFLYETSECIAPRPMIEGLRSKLVTYKHKKTILFDKESSRMCLGETKNVGIEKYFLGYLKNQRKHIEGPEVMNVIENEYFRVPVYKHSVPETDFILNQTSNNTFSIKRIDHVLLASKQMPLKTIPSPTTPIMQNILKRIIFQYLKKNGKIDVNHLIVLLNIFKYNFHGKDLNSYLQFSKDSQFFQFKPKVLKSKIDSNFTSDDYYNFLSCLNYSLKFDYNNEMKSRNYNETMFHFIAPWHIALSYYRGLQGTGYFDLSLLDGDLRQNKMTSFKYTETFINKRTKEEVDLRKLNKYQFINLLKKLGYKSHIGQSRWDLCHDLTLNATYSFDDAYSKYAKLTKKNGEKLKVGYYKKLQSIFNSMHKKMMDKNPVIFNETNVRDNDDDDIFDWIKSIKEKPTKSKNCVKNETDIKYSKFVDFKKINELIKYNLEDKIIDVVKVMTNEEGELILVNLEKKLGENEIKTLSNFSYLQRFIEKKPKIKKCLKGGNLVSNKTALSRKRKIERDLNDEPVRKLLSKRK